MRKFIWAMGVLSSLAFAQQQELRTSDYSDFQVTAGGPSEASPGTSASDLSISWEETDATIATGVGSLEVKRRYSSRQLWKAMPVNADAFGAAAAYPGAWFSTFSSYAIFRYQPPHGPYPLVEGKRWIQIRDVSGDLATTPTGDPMEGPLEEVLPASGGGVIRVTTKAGSTPDTEPSELTLVRPGQGRWTYEPYRTDTFGGVAGWQAVYRLTKVYGAEYGTSPICTFVYAGLDPTKVTRLDCAGGLRLSVAWGAFGVKELRESAGDAVPVGDRSIAQFTYASGQLVSASKNGIRHNYNYTVGSPGFTTSEGDVSGSSAYILFSKQQQHPALGCNGLPDGGLGGGFWFGPPANDQTRTTVGEWTYQQPTTGCYSAPRTTVYNPQAPGLNLEEQFVVAREKGITTSTTRLCQQNGNPCTDVRDTSQQWSVDWNKPQPVDEWFRDRRGVFTTTTAVEDVDQRAGVEFRTTLVTGLAFGATDALGTEAIKRVTLGWHMFDETGTREPLLESVMTASALVPGEAALGLTKFDKNTRHRRAEFRTGWTHDANGTNVKKTIGTFFFPQTMCDGQGTTDTNGRTVEIHGPCFVSSTAATDCDLSSSNEQIPITRFSYHSWDPQQPIPANAGRLASKTTFHTTNGATCSATNALTTEFNEYDVAGHVLRETSPAGVVTQRKYTDGNLESETVGSLTTKFWYAALQGGRLAGKQSPSGVWEVYCYRYGATSADCRGGTLTNNLQWKARIEGAGPSGNWVFVERTDFTYEQKPGAIFSPGEGRLVSERTTRGQSTVQTKYTYDALDRKSTTSVADLAGNPLYATQTAYDASGNVVGSSVPSSNAPVACGGLSTNASTGLEEATSAMCARSFYDRLSRLERTSSEGAVATTSFTYDEASNLKTVTDNRGQLVRYETDDFGNVVTIFGRWATSLPTQQSFDAQGKLRFKTAPVTGRVEFRYDAIGRPVYSGTTVAALWQRGYDGQTTPATNCPAVTNALKGRLQWQDDSFGRTWFDYDADGRVTALRRVRAGATACGSAPSSTSTNPDTTLIYDSTGRLSQQKYPHGLWVRFNWGEAGHQDEIRAIDYDPSGGQTFVPLIDGIAYNLGGVARYTIRSTTPVSVDYYRKGSQTIPTDCAFDPPGPDDGSGRMSTMQVKRGSANLLLRRYGWNAQQLTRQSTCLLAATTPVSETFQYDALQQLSTATRPAGEFSAQGGPYAELSYTFQNATERRYEASLGATSNTWWEHVYDAYGREIAQSPRNALNDTADRSWYRRSFGWNTEGTMTSILETGVPAAPKDFYGRRLAMTAANGLGNVYRSLSVNGAAYQYIYDATNRRRLKIYPSGRSDEFFYDGDHLIEDQGLVSTTLAGSGHVYDQYIWLGNLPVAIVRQRFSELGVRDTVTTDCKRNGETAACGTFFVVNDYLPKPVALVDSAGRLAGVGEYDAFGRVNTVSMRADAPAFTRTDGQNYPFGVYTPFHGSIATFKVPLRGGAVGRARVNYALVNTATANDKTQIRSGLRCNVNISPAYTGQLNTFATPWFSLASGTQYCVSWDANTSGGYGGAVTSTYEYQLFENSVGTPSWLPLRMPGQYADTESGLHENWHRFYEPQTGIYTAFDPLLPSTAHRTGYNYAAGNPSMRSDANGLQDGPAVGRRAQNSTNQAISDSDKCKAGDADACKRQKAVLVAGAAVLVASVAAAGAVAFTTAASAGTKVTVGTTVSTIVATKADAVARTISNGSQVTETIVREAMTGAPLQTQQSGGVSLPLVQDYVDKLLSGSPSPPIRVDGTIIVDGNHRYVAGMVVGIPPAIQPYPGGAAERVVPWADIPISSERW